MKLHTPTEHITDPEIALAMLKEGTLEPYKFMMSVLMSERYEKVAA